MNNATRFASITLATALIAGTGIAAYESGRSSIAPNNTSTIETASSIDIGGTIRWTSATTWTVLNDAGHMSEGIASVQPLADRVRVTYTECGDRVRDMQVTPDEQFASASVRVGASVGLCHADVFFYMGASSTPVNPALLTKAGANVWISGSLFILAD